MVRTLTLPLAAAFLGSALAFGPLAPFQSGRALKVISGIANFDQSLVSKVAWAAQQGGATHVDIAADPALVAAAKAAAPSLFVCVSAVDPELLPACVEAGADMVELGNFDVFYEEGRTFTAKDVADMTRRTRELLPSIPLSVTVPHTLHLEEQVTLAQELEMLGADVIQTEGKVSLHPSKGGYQGLIEKAAPALAAAHALSRAVSIPVMAASGLSDVTAPLALAAGAKGVGIGSAVNKLDNQVAMLAVVRSITQSMATTRTEAVEEPVAAPARVA
jgi:thiamine monophosphate synthase